MDYEDEHNGLPSLDDVMSIIKGGGENEEPVTAAWAIVQAVTNPSIAEGRAAVGTLLMNHFGGSGTMMSPALQLTLQKIHERFFNWVHFSKITDLEAKQETEDGLTQRDQFMLLACKRMATYHEHPDGFDDMDDDGDITTYLTWLEFNFGSLFSLLSYYPIRGQQLEQLWHDATALIWHPTHNGAPRLLVSRVERLVQQNNPNLTIVFPYGQGRGVSGILTIDRHGQEAHVLLDAAYCVYLDQLLIARLYIEKVSDSQTGAQS